MRKDRGLCTKKQKGFYDFFCGVDLEAGCSVVLFYPNRILSVLTFVFCFQVQKQELVKAGVYVYQDANDATRGPVLFHDCVLF